MKFSTPKIVIPSLSFRLEVIVGIVLLYIIILCLVFRSCLQVSFEGFAVKNYGDNGMGVVESPGDNDGNGYYNNIKSKPKSLNGDDSHDIDSPEYTKRGNVHDSDTYISKSSDYDNLEKLIEHYESTKPPGFVLTPEFKAFISEDFEKAITINPGLEDMCRNNNNNGCKKFVDTKGNERFIYLAPIMWEEKSLRQQEKELR